MLISAGEVAQHEHSSVIRVRVSAQDADQTAGRHGSVIRVVRQSQGTLVLQVIKILLVENLNQWKLWGRC